MNNSEAKALIRGAAIIVLSVTAMGCASTGAEKCKPYVMGATIENAEVKVSGTACRTGESGSWEVRDEGLPLLEALKKFWNTL